MSLDHFEQQVEQLRAEADRIRGTANARHKEIDNDPTLSDEGKRLAYAENDVKPQVSAIRVREEKLIADKIDELESRIDAKTGNTATDIIAFRDAQDRAERLNDADEAERLITRAMRTGDTSLAHAVFRRAMDARWSSITKVFVAANPDLKDVVRDLQTLTQFRDDTWQRTFAYAGFK